MQQCFISLPVGQSQGPGTGSTVQGVPDLGLLAVGACFDGEQASGWTLVVQYCYLDWAEQGTVGDYWQNTIQTFFCLFFNRLKQQWTAEGPCTTNWTPSLSSDAVMVFLRTVDAGKRQV